MHFILYFHDPIFVTMLFLIRGYMAPEYVVHGQLTEKADVYSYGILVLEVLTGKKNTSSVSSSSESQSLVSQVLIHSLS